MLDFIQGEEKKMNNEIKSQDDLNKQGRESDVLIATINKCQELEQENERLNKKLKIAVAALKEYATIQTYDWIDSQSVAKKALNDIDEVK